VRRVVGDPWQWVDVVVVGQGNGNDENKRRRGFGLQNQKPSSVGLVSVRGA